MGASCQPHGPKPTALGGACFLAREDVCRRLPSKAASCTLPSSLVSACPTAGLP